MGWVGFKKNCENRIKQNRSNLIGLGLELDQNRPEPACEHPYKNRCNYPYRRGDSIFIVYFCWKCLLDYLMFTTSFRRHVTLKYKYFIYPRINDYVNLG